MRSFFSVDNIIFRGISRIGDMFILSFFWLITSIFIVTIGAATTALFDVSIKILRKKDGSIAKDFFISFKNNFKQATAIWLVALVTGVILYADVYYWAYSEGIFALIIGALNAGACIVYLAVLIFVFAVLAVFENSIINTIKTAFLMSLKHWTTTITLLLCLFGISYVCWILPIAAFVMLIFGVGAFALLFSVRFITIFRLYNAGLAPDNLD